MKQYRVRYRVTVVHTWDVEAETLDEGTKKAKEKMDTFYANVPYEYKLLSTMPVVPPRQASTARTSS